ncbi:MAG: head-tail connector protein [Devosia sp.]
MHAPVLVTAPAETVLSVDEVKAHLRLDDTDQDSLLAILIAAATAHLDGWSGILGRCLIEQTWRQNFDEFAQCLRLPLLALAISSVKVQASDGTIATVAASNYTLQQDEVGSFVRFKDDYDYPSDLYQTKAIAVEFTAGYGAAAAVPANAKMAMLLLVAHWFENREAVNIGNITSTLPFAVDALLAPLRRIGI